MSQDRRGSKEVIIDNESFRLTWNINKVLSVSHSSRSNVQGGGRTMVVDGTGGGASHISSTTEEHTQLWYLAPNGKERDIQRPTRISAREGHTLIFLWLIGDLVVPPTNSNFKPDETPELLIAMYNYTTGRLVWNKSDMPYTRSRETRPWNPAGWPFIFSLLLIAFYGLGILTTTLLWHQIIRVQKYDDHLAKQKVKIEVERDLLLSELSKLEEPDFGPKAT